MVKDDWCRIFRPTCNCIGIAWLGFSHSNKINFDTIQVIWYIFLRSSCILTEFLQIYGQY